MSNLFLSKLLVFLIRESGSSCCFVAGRIYMVLLVMAGSDSPLTSFPPCPFRVHSRGQALFCSVIQRLYEGAVRRVGSSARVSDGRGYTWPALCITASQSQARGGLGLWRWTHLAANGNLDLACRAVTTALVSAVRAVCIGVRVERAAGAVVLKKREAKVSWKTRELRRLGLD